MSEQNRDAARKLGIAMVYYWQGRPINDLTREELLAAFVGLAEEYSAVESALRRSTQVRGF